MPGLGLSLAIFGRAGLVGITDQPFGVYSYTELLGKEAEVVGCADHLLHELDLLVEFARRGALDLSDVVTDTVGLDADAANDALDRLERFGGRVRTVIVPTGLGRQTPCRRGDGGPGVWRTGGRQAKPSSARLVFDVYGCWCVKTVGGTPVQSPSVETGRQFHAWQPG